MALKRELQIFVVDDDDAIRQVIANFLKSEGHEVYEFANPKDALAEISAAMMLNEKPDLVISDLVMSGASGELVLWHAKKISEGEIGTILMSGGSDEEVKDAARSAKTDAFIIKPLHLNDITKAIDEIFPELVVG